MASGLGSPATPLRKALLALAAAFRRGIGKSSLRSLLLIVTLPEAKTGASFFIAYMRFCAPSVIGARIGFTYTDPSDKSMKVS